MVLDGQRMGDERDWVLVGFFVTCSSSAEKRFIRPAKQDEMGLCPALSISAGASQSNGECRPAPIPAIKQSIDLSKRPTSLANVLASKSKGEKHGQ